MTTPNPHTKCIARTSLMTYAWPKHVAESSGGILNVKYFKTFLCNLLVRTVSTCLKTTFFTIFFQHKLINYTYTIGAEQRKWDGKEVLCLYLRQQQYKDYSLVTLRRVIYSIFTHHAQRPVCFHASIRRDLRRGPWVIGSTACYMR